MNILICGSSGFIGTRLASALHDRGHTVLRGVRDAVHARQAHPDQEFVEVDFQRDTSPELWAARLRGVDVVINAVGIFKESSTQRFETLHVHGPAALFQACVTAGVRRVIQISALGADAQADTPYHLSKRAADEALLSLPINSVVVQPSLVFGAQGTSARWFTALATLPWIPLPGPGDQLIQPVHIDDLCAAVVRLAGTHDHSGERIPMVGGLAMSLRAYLVALRHALGLGRPRFINVPRPLVGQLARWGKRWRGAVFDEDSWRMLERGNVGDNTTMTALLGHPPRAPAQFLDASEVASTRALARQTWMVPMLRLSLAFVWLVSGIVSLGLYPVDASLAMLARVGIGDGLAPWMLYGAATLDLLLALATLFWPHRRLWVAQAALVLGYTAILSIFLPELWLHPFGPLSKNLPFLAVLWALYTFEDRP